MCGRAVQLAVPQGICASVRSVRAQSQGAVQNHPPSTQTVSGSPQWKR